MCSADVLSFGSVLIDMAVAQDTTTQEADK